MYTSLYCEPLIPREVFFEPPKVLGIKISPDGKKLSYIGSTQEGIRNVYLCNQVDSLENALCLTNFSEPDIKQFFFSADSQKLIFLKDTNGDQRYHIYSIDLQSRSVTDHTQGKTNITTKIYKLSPKQNKVVIGINDRNPQFHDVYLLDIDTNEITLLFTNDQYYQFLFDDQLHLVYKSRIQSNGSIQIYNAYNELLFFLTPEDAFHTKLLHFDYESNLLYFLDTQDSNTTTLKQLHTQTKKQANLANDPLSDITEVYFENQKPIAYATEYIEKKWHGLNDSISKELNQLTKLIGSNFSIISQTQDGNNWIIKSSHPTKKVRFFYFDRKKEELNCLFSYPNTDDLANMYPFLTKARDGLDLICYLTIPKSEDQNGKTKRPIPLIVFPHGGPFQVRDSLCFHPYHQWLANRGYAVLSVNFRLSSGLGKKHVNLGNGQWGRKAQEDLIDAVNWCMEQQITTKDQIAIFGGSYGGFSALAGLAFTPNVYACGVAICGPSNLKTVLDHVPVYWDFPSSPLSDNLMHYTKGAFIKSMGGDPDKAEGIQELEQRSPLNYAQQITKPLLLIHGDLDMIVAKSESDQIFEKMKQNGKKVTYLHFPDEGHGFRRFCNIMIYLAYAEKTLAENLKGRFEPLNLQDLQKSKVIIQTSDQTEEAIKVNY